MPTDKPGTIAYWTSQSRGMTSIAPGQSHLGVRLPPFQGGGRHDPPPRSAIESVPQRGPLTPPPCRGGPSRTNRHLGRSPFFAGLSRFIPVHSGPSRPVPVAAGRNRAHSVERCPSAPFGPRPPPGVVNGVHASTDSVYSPFHQPRPYRTPGQSHLGIMRWGCEVCWLGAC